MPYVRFQTNDLALVRRKLAAAKLLHGPLADSIGRQITLSVLPAPGAGFLAATDGDRIWCRGVAEPVRKLGRRYAHLHDCKLSPAAQHEAPIWMIDICAVES